MENGIWEPDPGNAECTLSGGFVTAVATPILGTVVLVDMIIQVYHCKHDCFIPAMCDEPLYVLHILSDSFTNIYRYLLFWISYCWN